MKNMNHEEDKSRDKLVRKGLSGLNSIPIFSPVGISVLIFVFGLMIDGGDLEKNSTVGTMCFFLCLTLFLFSGVLIIYRREVPRQGLPSIKGSLAIIEGVLWIIVNAFLMLFFLIGIIT